MILVRGEAMRTIALGLLLLSMAACASDVETVSGARGGGGGSGDAGPPPSRCRQYVDEQACCAHAKDDDEPCAWLAPEPGLPGRCIGIDENCTDHPACPSGQHCQMYAQTTAIAGVCIGDYYYDVHTWGVCVE